MLPTLSNNRELALNTKILATHAFLYLFLVVPKCEHWKLKG